MAATDYTTRIQGLQFCPVANLSGPAAPLDTMVAIRSLKHTFTGDVYVGMTAMLGMEIVKVTGLTGDFVTLDRGCADTIPAAWPAGTEIWFLDGVLRGDSREYLGTSTIAVKVLPRTSSGTTAVTAAPPQQITFNSRFIRPYPPAKVTIGFDHRAWYLGAQLTVAAPTLPIDWVHRNRVLQADVLVGHAEAGITPEMGQTYDLLFRDSAGALLGTSSLATVTGTVLVLQDLAMLLGFSTDTGVKNITVNLHSKRDGYLSMYGYQIALSLDTAGLIPTDKLALDSSGVLLRESGGMIKLENN